MRTKSASFTSSSFLPLRSATSAASSLRSTTRALLPPPPHELERKLTQCSLKDLFFPFESFSHFFYKIPSSRSSESDVRRCRRCRYIDRRSTISRDKDSEKRMRISKTRIDGGDGEDEIEVVREKIMFELQTVADKMKDAILRKEEGEEDEKEQEEPTATIAPSSAAAAEARPWDLRTRRAACKAPIADGSGKCLKIEEKKLNHSPSRTGNTNGRFNFLAQTAYSFNLLFKHPCNPLCYPLSVK